MMICVVILFVLVAQVASHCNYPKESDRSGRIPGLCQRQKSTWIAGIDERRAVALTGVSKPCNLPNNCDNFGALRIPIATYRPYGWSRTLKGAPQFVQQVSRMFTKMVADGKGADVAALFYNGGAACRYKRGPCRVGSYSLHSWGMAMDLNPYRNSANSQGCFDNFGNKDGYKSFSWWVDKLLPYTMQFGLYWGTCFSNYDSHHWEISRRMADKYLNREVKVDGSFPPPPATVDRCKQSFGAAAACGNPTACQQAGGKVETGFCPGGNDNKCCHSKPAPVSECVKRYGTAAKCQDISLCKTSTVRHLCPGGVNNRCCLPPTPPARTPAPTPKPTTTPRPTPRPVSTCVPTYGKTAKCIKASSCTGVVRTGRCAANPGTECCVPSLCQKTFGTTSKCIADKAGAESACTGSLYLGVYCAPGEVCCGPLKNTPPIGDLTSTANGYVTGWACDLDAKGKAINVHLYEGGPAGTNNAALTSLSRACPSCMGKPLPSGVDFKKCGCTAGGSRCPVGFRIKYTLINGLADKADGASVKMYGYAINVGPPGPVQALKGNGIVLVLPPKPPLAECDDFIAAGCRACVNANEGKTCNGCYIDGSFSCIKKGAACPAGDMFETDEKCVAQEMKEEEQAPEPPVLSDCLSPYACDSTKECCADCVLLPEGSPCSDASPDGCKMPAKCDGASQFCPSRERKPVGTPCDDFDPCTDRDVCTLEGTCRGEYKGFDVSPGCGCKTDADCDDGNECTKDTCDTSTGKCHVRADPSLAGRLCRRVQSRNGCDIEEFCDGESIECPEDRHQCDNDYFEADEESPSSPMEPGSTPGIVDQSTASSLMFNFVCLSLLLAFTL
mmetsp:Transcript_5987/g.10226  ORF Transcript_5987/g.10226 Transcript_5987/m.10226 type:complete len:842 (+) Transcript_5987:41-2566(+)